MKLKQWVVAASLVAAGTCAWALPSVQDVESAVKQGQYAQAETMMKEVVDAKPNSARGHYLYAEILAHNARFGQAAEEARAASKIDPAIGFTQPEKFRAFQDLLAREQRAETTRATTSSSTTAPQVAAERSTTAPVAPARENAPQGGGVPGWIWIVGLAVIAYALWRGFSRSRAPTGAAVMPANNAGAMPGQGVGPAGYPPNGPMGGPGYGQAPGGYGPGYAPQAGSRGGGLLGTGLAAAGGVAAGMALDRMMHSGESGRPANYADGGSGDLSQASNFNNGGGNDAARQLEDRGVDFGTGGNDWGGDAGGGGGGGSFDGGGGGGSDDGGGGGGWD